MVLLALFEDLVDVLLGVLDLLNLNDTSQENVCGSVGKGGRDDTGAIDEVDTLHERNVLPDLCLAGDGCDGAHLLGAKGVDDGRLSGVGVPDETNGNLFALGVERRELTKQLNEGSFAEGVVDIGVEGEGGVVFGEAANPGSLKGLSALDST